MKRRSVSLVFNIFLAVGMIMLIVSLVLYYNSKRFEATAVKTSGTVVDLIAKSSGRSSGTMYSPVVTYTDANGTRHRYIANFSSNPPGYTIGETIAVYYDPKNPDRPHLAGWGEYIGVMVTSFIGLVFSLIGGCYHILRKLKRRRSEQLKQSGVLIRADFVSVEVNTFVSVNRRNPFFIRCEWKDPLTGKTLRFDSGAIWSDPTRAIDPNKKIDVYMDQHNSRRYYVDISLFEV